jgi:peptidoglycan/LPS O-acetylase OafA/YrhL
LENGVSAIMKKISDSARLLGAACIVFLLLALVVFKQEPAWFNFWLLAAIIVVVCFILSRVITWIHDFFID